MAVTAYDIAIVGAGPAGSSAAIIAARTGGRVLLLDRGRFPRHKVCGEFVSTESVQLLDSLLGSRTLSSKVPEIRKAELHFGSRTVATNIAPSALGISRYTLDEELLKAAQGAGVDVREGVTVSSAANNKVIARDGCEFTARTIINAGGKWSELSQSSSGEKWLGLKAHFRGEVKSGTVQLFFFDDGYCGIQPVAAETVNVSALIRMGRGKNLAEVFGRCPQLRSLAQEWQPLTETFSTFPVQFQEPHPVANGILQVGDAAGFIDPFVGDGISMALQSGAMAARAVMSVDPAENYLCEYTDRLLPAFTHAARFRRLIFEDSGLRDAAILAARVPGVLAWMLRATRARVA